jgi:hypothetical protein
MMNQGEGCMDESKNNAIEAPVIIVGTMTLLVFVNLTVAILPFDRFDEFFVVPFGICYGSVGLAAVWLGRGAGRLLLRLPFSLAVLASAVTTVMGMASLLEDGRGWWLVCVVLSLFLLAASGIAGLWRMIAWSHANWGRRDQWQFSLRKLLIAMAAVALLATLFRYLAASDFQRWILDREASWWDWYLVALAWQLRIGPGSSLAGPRRLNRGICFPSSWRL